MKERILGFNYCPMCGTSSFWAAGNNSYLCEGCQFRYFINNSAAVACLIVNEEGDLLLTRRAVEPNQGMLDLPGGFVEPQETIENAIVREIKEELNLDVCQMKYLISYPNLYPYSGLLIPTADLAFVCQVESFTSIKAGDDVSDVEFIKPESIDPELLCSNSMKKIIAYYIAHKNKQ